MNNIKYRQYLRPHCHKTMGAFHYWGFIDDGFTHPFGKNDAVNNGDKFTGLNDKNGVEVYEGDIVKVNSRNSAVIGPVIFKGTAYGFTVPVDSPFEESFRPINDGWYGTEVIGNIHENPELLEQAE